MYGYMYIYVSLCRWVWMVVRFVFVIRAPVCPVCPVCVPCASRHPRHDPRCLFRIQITVLFPLYYSEVTVKLLFNYM